MVKRHYAAVRERWAGLDWLILNAGIMALPELELDTLRRLAERQCMQREVRGVQPGSLRHNCCV